MPNNNESQFSRLTNITRSALLDAIKAHEQSDEHKGEPCWHERVNVIAWLCHSIGIEPEQLSQVADLLRSYNKDCPLRHDAKTKFHLN